MEIHEDKAVVGNIFRCINMFAFDNQHNVIAMPVVASGNQKVSLDKMLTGNKKLHQLAAAIESAYWEFKQYGKSVKRYHSFMYQAGSWDTAQNLRTF